MSDQFSAADGEAYIHRMKAARKGTAVLKSRLVTLRSAIPRCPIFAFEGNEDKIVYHHWINRIRPGLKYEPFPCGGKTYVLQLKEIAERDLSNLSDGLYFFVDRDFDDLRGKASSSVIFMTDAYSVENYLVSEHVLEELLKNEFHCHALPEKRNEVIQLFKRVYKQFLQVTRETNYRLFLARRLQIELNAHLTDKISHLASLTVDSVAAGTRPATDLIRVAREASHDERSTLEPEFNDLDPNKRYRGKFALLFFSKWLEHLANDRNDPNPKYFLPIEDGGKANAHGLNLGSFASKSEFPLGLVEFLATVPQPEVR